MHFPPPNMPTSMLAQKLSDPPSCVNVQQSVLPLPAFLQSLALAQI
jgi:hypothetical protein